jgi:hypothetical protein
MIPFRRRIPTILPFVAGKSQRLVVFHQNNEECTNLGSGGNSVTVTVVDRCEGCAEYDLDFSPAAFDVLASESVGR